MSHAQEITPAELRRLPGSLREHQRRQAALLTYLALNRVPAMPIHTGPRVARGPDGEWQLRKNTEQRGCADVLACLPPDGRLALFELKTGRARRSKAQVAVHKRFADAGALCIEVRDVVRDVGPHMPRGSRLNQGGTR